MSSSSPISICSNALLRLGGSPISSFEDPSKYAPAAGNIWPTVRDAILRAHYWNFATKRVLLAPRADAPAFDYRFAFDVPGDWLRTLQVGQAGWAHEFQKEGRSILANINPLPLVYIFRNDETSTWDDAVVEVAELKMAAALAYLVTASTSLRDSYNQEADVMLARAKSLDGQDGSPEQFPDSPLLAARFGG
ncbi:hypothetical protein RVU96_16790 [Bordetella avium]|nr:hypothetical protein [Bordetella avium]RIQ11571.1 hypothetical protein D0432_16310 [Bordetella avium]RIQ44930.1 hypothetical protein D0845_17130 [Bordetella avium]RIQ49580.1 hypothetical protein D0844_16425 [Bordetella avium]RIQ55323.1 hypothetical protein D0841_16525 [Bordetella avium]RIQ58425.1 hypothetical protein D0842_16520 [Bordetella avium]